MSLYPAHSAYQWIIKKLERSVQEYGNAKAKKIFAPLVFDPGS